MGGRVGLASPQLSLGGGLRGRDGNGSARGLRGARLAGSGLVLGIVAKAKYAKAAA